MKGRNISDGHEKSPLHIRNAEHAYLELCELHDYKKIECVDKKKKLRDIMDIHEEIYGIVTAALFDIPACYIKRSHQVHLREP